MAIQKLRPFKLWVLQNFPFIAEDFDALTNYELMCKIVEYLNNVIDVTNAQTSVINEVDGKIQEINDYVNQYFDNLDVQDEINNKLDDMAQSGELEEIISAYLNTNCILAYNTLNDLKNATNIIDGSFARTYGKVTMNDGLGYFYKIREIQNTDVVDEDNIVSINTSNTLIAEKIKGVTVQDIQNIQDEIDKEYTVMMGDSYGVGESTPSNVTGWCDLLKDLLNIPNDKYYKIVHGGTGFIGYNSFYDLLINNISSIPENIRPKIKRFIIASGSNDINHAVNQYNALKSATQTFFDYVKTQFPNAEITLFHTGYTTANTHDGALERDRANLTYMCYKEALMGYDVKLYKGCCYPLRLRSNVSSDNVHPTQEGYNQIAQSMYNMLLTGQNNFVRDYYYNSSVFDNISLNSGITFNNQDRIRIFTLYDNDKAHQGSVDGFGNLKFSSPLQATATVEKSIGTITPNNFNITVGSIFYEIYGFARDTSNNLVNFNARLILHDDGTVGINFYTALGNLTNISRIDFNIIDKIRLTDNI